MSVQAELLQQAATMTTSNKEHRSALLAAGLVPALVRLEQSSSKPVQDKAVSAVFQLLQKVLADRDTALIARIIPQVVPLLRHRNKDIQYTALGWLGKVSRHSEALAQLIVAAGAIPAVTDALHGGQGHARLRAASLLMQLATVGGMGIDTALAGAVPAAVSVLQCGTAEQQLEAVALLGRWASLFQGAIPMTARLDTFLSLVPLLSSQGSGTQQAVTALLSKLLSLGGGAQAAVDEGAVPAFVEVLHSRDLHACFFAADALQGILTECSQAANMAAAAGAIKPLVSILASSSARQLLAGSYGSAGAAPPQSHCRPVAYVSTEQWQEAASGSLCSIAAAGHQHCTAMVAAGAVPAITSAADRAGKVQQLALHTLKHLLADAGNQAAVASQVLQMLHSNQLSMHQVAVKVALSHLHVDDSFRAAFLTAGGAAALVSLLGIDTDPLASKWAVSFTDGFVKGPVEAAAVVEAGAVPPLAHLLQNSSDADARTAAAHVLCAIAVFTSVHRQLAQVIPQLLQALRSDDRQLQWLVGGTLQILAGEQEASLLQGFRATKHQWQPLLASSCSEAQRYAAGAIHYYVLGGDCQGHSEHIKALFKSRGVDDPGQCASLLELVIKAEHASAPSTSCAHHASITVCGVSVSCHWNTG